MSFYENLVMETQMNYSIYYSLYAAGKTPYALSEKLAFLYEEQIDRLVKEIEEAKCIQRRRWRRFRGITGFSSVPNAASMKPGTE